MRGLSPFEGQDASTAAPGAPHLGWGILGPGTIAKLFVRDLHFAGMSVQAVGSRSAARAEAFAQAFGIPRAHGSYQALVEDPAVDVIYVATPLTCHLEHAALALQAGKHVLVEKPFTTNLGEAIELRALARSAGLAVMEGMWTRFLPHMLRLRELVRRGVLGEVRAVHADLSKRYVDVAAQRLGSVDLGGGALYDLGTYPLAFAVDMLGPATKISALGSLLRPGGVDDNVTVALQHEAGALSTSHASLEVKGTVRASVIGTLQRVEIDTLWYRASSYTRYDEDNYVVERFENPSPNRGMQYEALELERLIAEGLTESAVMSLDESVEVMRILDEAKRQIGLRFPGDQGGRDAR